MKIARIRIQNFRSFKDETIHLNDYTCLVGPNGSGKSTILCALNIFFRDTFHSGSDNTILRAEDYYCKNTAEPIRITVTFTDLSEAAQKEFEHYFRQGGLSVTAQADFNAVTGTAEVKQFGERMGIARFAQFFNEGGTAQTLKTIYEQLRAEFTDLPPPGTKPKMTEALQDYEANHSDQCELIPSADEFYGFTKGGDRLEKYIQWVYVPAVKDASNEQIESKNTALGRLLARTVRATVNFHEGLQTIKNEAQIKYDVLLAQHQASLNQLSHSLQSKLQEWSHPDVRLKLQWRNEADRALTVASPLVETIAGEGSFDGALKNFGHGLQRSYLLALLQELATISTEQSPTLILGCEEPELYQHPPQARHLASVFLKLAGNNSQIIVSTHSPYFVSGKGFEDVRYVRRDRSVHESKVQHLTHADLVQRIAVARGESLPSGNDGAIAKIHQALQPQLNEMFFTPTLILVEGIEDVSYITTYLHLMNLWEEFRRHGCHIVPANKKDQLFNPIAIAQKVCIPLFVIFDADTDTSDTDKLEKHRKDNLTILNLCGISSPNPLPSIDFWSPSLVMWRTDIGKTFKGDIEASTYESTKQAVHQEFDHEENMTKNSLFIAELLTRLWTAGKRSQNLERLCNSILEFARSVNCPPPTTLTPS